MYDYAFELRDVDTAAPLALSFAQQVCEEPIEEPAFALDLPLDSAPQGIVCRQLPVGILSWLGRCGGLHQPCTDTCEGTSSEPGCDEGLTCDTDDSASGLCLAPCGTDDDCPLPDVEVCDDGLCRVPDVF